MKFIFLIVLTICAGLQAKPGFVIHPKPKPPVYLSPDFYANLKEQFPAPPKVGSPEQKEDEEGILKAQKARTPADCERANSEILVSLESFFGPNYGLLDAASTKTLTPFFEQIRNDGDFFVQKLKIAYPRPRPFTYFRSALPCVAKEVTPAYPSGHAVLSRVYFLVLSDFYPENRTKFEERANQIGNDRVLSGMHHPSDVYNGQKLGDSIYAELKKSPKFQKDFDTYKKALAAPVPATTSQPG